MLKAEICEKKISNSNTSEIHFAKSYKKDNIHPR